MQNIVRLEAIHKITRSVDNKLELEALVAKLKLFDAVTVAKELVYAKQHVFEYRDKPNKNLARILAGIPIN